MRNNGTTLMTEINEQKQNNKKHMNKYDIYSVLIMTKNSEKQSCIYVSL